MSPAAASQRVPKLAFGDVQRGRDRRQVLAVQQAPDGLRHNRVRGTHDGPLEQPRRRVGRGGRRERLAEPLAGSAPELVELDVLVQQLRGRQAEHGRRGLRAHVATLLRDGAPHSVPVWVGFEDGRVAFLSSPTSVKARNVRRDPRVSISITQADAPTTMAQVRGRVGAIVDGDRGWAIIDAIAHKYIGAPYPLRTDRVVFLVDVEHAWAQAF